MDCLENVLQLSKELNKLINFHTAWNHETNDFLMISQEVKVNQFAWICLILEEKFWDNPLFIAVAATLTVNINCQHNCKFIFTIKDHIYFNGHI